jgi:DNA-binding transcriptional LysR family regulator
MDLRQLHAVVAIAEYGSFSAAADALGTVQSNVSTHIRNLERELGALLVDRASGALTEVGEVVVSRARRVENELHALQSDVVALSREVVGTVRFGAIGTTARWLVPQLLEVAPARHPRLHLVFVEATTIGLDAQLASGKVDLGVLALPAPGSELRATPLFEEDLVLVVPKSHPLSSDHTISLAKLADLRLILPLPGSAYRDELDQAVRATGGTLIPRAETDSVRLIVSLTFEGSGLSILPAGAIPASRNDDWSFLSVQGLPPRQVAVAQARRGLPSAPMRAVLDILFEIVANRERVPAGVRPIPREGVAHT